MWGPGYSSACNDYYISSSLMKYTFFTSQDEIHKNLDFIFNIQFVYLFVFDALRPKSSAMVKAVSSSNHTFFLGELELAVIQYLAYIISLVTDNNPS